MCPNELLVARTKVLLTHASRHSWLTGGTTVGSSLTYLAGDGTGSLLRKRGKKEGDARMKATAAGRKIDEQRR